MLWLFELLKQQRVLALLKKYKVYEETYAVQERGARANSPSLGWNVSLDEEIGGRVAQSTKLWPCSRVHAFLTQNEIRPLGGSSEVSQESQKRKKLGASKTGQ